MGVIINIPHTVNNSSYDDDYEAWSIRISAASGWLFTGTPTISYTDTKGVAQNKTLTVNGAKTMLTGSFYLTNADTVFTVNGEIKDANALSIINNIPNAVAKVTKATDGTTANFEVTANTDFKFASAPKVNYISVSTTKQQTLTLSQNDTVAKGSAGYADFSKDFTFSGDTVSTKIAELNVTNGISGTTETHTYDGTKANVTVTGNNPRYRFISPKISYTDTLGTEKSVDMTVENNQSGSVANSVLLDVDPSKPITVTGQYVNVVHVETGLSNCHAVQALPDYYLQHSHVEITLQANDNTEFKETPILLHVDVEGLYVTKYFTVSGDKKTATIAYDLPTDYEISSLDIHAEAVPIAVIGSKYGAINAYIVTLDNLNDFAKKRFIKATNTNGVETYELIDLGKYVNRIKRIYLPITSNLNDVIRCGNYNTGIKCTDLPKDIFEINFGDIDIPLINGDSNDFNTGDLSIFIPFVGVVSLDNSLIGKTVNLVMKINAITGNGVSILTCNGVIFDTQNVVASTDVLFTGTNSNIYKIGGDDWNEQILMGIEPYVILNYTDSINAPINTTLENVTVSDVTGFAQFENVNLNAANLLVDEYNEIVSQLETGVYL